MIKSPEQFVAFSQGNVEALMQSGQVLANGLQDLGRHVASSLQSSLEEQLAIARAVAATKSVRDAVDVQAQHVRAAISRSVAETSKLTDLSIKLTEQVMAPLAARLSVASEQLGRAA